MAEYSGPSTMTYGSTYTVHTGTDIYAIFNDFVVTTMQGISHSITRQKAPIYVMGSEDPIAIARSKRGIAGSLVFTSTDRHCLADFMQASKFYAKKNSITASLSPYAAGMEGLPTRSDVVKKLEAGNQLENVVTAETSETSIASITTRSRPMFTDQLLPFDSTLVGANEYGGGTMMRIIGIEILNEGSGISIDDSSNEIQMTYLARTITPWIRYQEPGKSS